MYIILLSLITSSVFAEDAFVTRRDGFILIWQSINRPAYETSYASFRDINKDDPGSREIVWAKRRKILDDNDRFYPNDPLRLEDALLWIYRTRNIGQPADMERSDLSLMMQAYPLLEEGTSLGDTVKDAGMLLRMMRTLDETLAKEVHEVSYYADDFHGEHTAFGEIFDMNAITAAHRTFPQDTLVRVTNVANGEHVVVRINDRGPYVNGRDMDLSLGAFQKIAHKGEGVISATFERLGDKDLVDQCAETKRTYYRRIVDNVRFFRGIPHTFTIGKQLVLQSTQWFVVRDITFPDGVTTRIQDYIAPGEKYRFTPSEAGEYTFIVGTKDGRRREMRMVVQKCDVFQ